MNTGNCVIEIIRIRSVDLDISFLIHFYSEILRGKNLTKSRNYLFSFSVMVRIQIFSFISSRIMCPKLFLNFATRSFCPKLVPCLLEIAYVILIICDYLNEDQVTWIWTCLFLIQFFFFLRHKEATT